MFNNMTHSAIIDLFNEAPTRFLTNEISIFKAKYNKMVADKKLNRVPFVTPNFGDSDDSEALDDFINYYVDELSDDRREAIINTYGVSNAMDLLFTFYNKYIGYSEDEVKAEMETNSLSFIEKETIVIILHDAIGAQMEWKYL